MSPNSFEWFKVPTVTELAGAMAGEPPEQTIPEITVERCAAGCHLFWHLQGEQNALSFCSDYRTEDVWKIWIWLFDLSFGKQTSVLHLMEDLEGRCFWGVQQISDTEIQCFIWEQRYHYFADETSGLEKNAIRTFAFQGQTHLFIQHLSQALLTAFSNRTPFFDSFSYECDVSDYKALTLTEWPWGLFSQWYQERHKKSRDQVIQALIRVFAQATEYSILFQMARDDVDRLAFEYAWTLMVNQILPLCCDWELQDFEAYCEPLLNFLEGTDAAWNESQLHGNLEETAYDGFAETPQREALAYQYRLLLLDWREKQNTAIKAFKAAQPSQSFIEACFRWPKILTSS